MTIWSLNRFADDTRHMIIFDVVSDDSPWGSKGDRMRLYLNDAGHGKAEQLQKEGMIISAAMQKFLQDIFTMIRNQWTAEFQMKQEGG